MTIAPSIKVTCYRLLKYKMVTSFKSRLHRNSTTECYDNTSSGQLAICDFVSSIIPINIILYVYFSNKDEDELAAEIDSIVCAALSAYCMECNGRGLVFEWRSATLCRKYKQLPTSEICLNN